jgi:hypothetical protein
MKEQKFVSLSAKSLDTVYDWCEQNIDDDPLARAYIGICVAIAQYDASEVMDRIYQSWPVGVKVSGRLFSPYRFKIDLYESRDTLGRVVLETIRRDLRKIAADIHKQPNRCA